MSDSELIEQLQRATSGLLWTSESDSPFAAFVWEKPPSLLGNVKGNFTPQDLRERLGLPPDIPVERVEFDRFFAGVTREEDWHDKTAAEEVRQYRALVELLRDSLQDITVYRVGEIEIEIYIVGQTPSGNWAGLSTQAVET